LGISKETKALVTGGVGAETRQVLTNMKNILEEAGSSMSKALKCTIFLADMGHFAEVNAVYGEFFPSEPPARACFAVLALPVGALVEIDCIALA
jgi:2-iminobutanoate/2-iminopropanoate deaminase